MAGLNVDVMLRVEKKKPKGSRRARNTLAEEQPTLRRRTSREMEDLFARLELLPTSSPLPSRPQIKSEEELALAVEELRKDKATAEKKQRVARRLRPALVEKSTNASTEGKKVLRVQTKPKRIELGARAKAAAATLQRRRAGPTTPPRPRRCLLEESPLNPTPAPSSSFEFDVD